MAPPSAQAEILAQPFLYGLRKRASEQERLDADFEAQLKAHSEELAIRSAQLKNFELSEAVRTKQEFDASQSELTRQGQMDRAVESAKAKAETAFWKDISTPKLPPLAAFVRARDSGHFTVEELEVFKAEVERRENATTGLTEDKRLESQARTEKIRSEKLTDEAKRKKIENDNRFFDDTYAERIELYQAELDQIGASTDLKKAQKAKLDAELPYVDDQIKADLAIAAARVPYLEALMKAVKDKNSGAKAVVGRKAKNIEAQLDKDRQSMKEIESKEIEAKADWNATKKADGLEEDVAYYEERYLQFRDARLRMKKSVEEGEAALENLYDAVDIEDAEGEVPPVTPKIDKTLKGKIGR